MNDWLDDEENEHSNEEMTKEEARAWFHYNLKNRYDPFKKQQVGMENALSMPKPEEMIEIEKMNFKEVNGYDCKTAFEDLKFRTDTLFQLFCPQVEPKRTWFKNMYDRFILYPIIRIKIFFILRKYGGNK